MHGELGARGRTAVNVLIVYAHPEAKSFNGAMRDIAVATLTRSGHQVVVSDLYQMRFNPVVGLGDFMGERADPGFFSVRKSRPRHMSPGRSLLTLLPRWKS